MSKRRNRTRARRRREQRAVANAAARGAIEQAEAEERPRQARHKTAIEVLRSRGSITPAMVHAAQRFETDFRGSDSVIGQLVQAYAPRHRSRQKFVAAPDEPAAIRSRERVERALRVCGPLAEVVIAVVIFDEAPAAWAQMNGFKSPDGAGCIRVALRCLSDHYAGRRSPRLKVVLPPGPDRTPAVTATAALDPEAGHAEAAGGAQHPAWHGMSGGRFKSPKSPRSRRTIALPASAVEILQRHKADQAKERLALGLGRNESDLVFTQLEGEPVIPNNFSKAFTQLARRAGLPEITFHSLRHTHATEMLRANVHPKVVSERLGHASIAITLDTYSHVVPGMQEDAAARIDAGLRTALGG